jgi:hypothetical protein
MELAAVETLAMLHPSVAAAPTDTTAVSSIGAGDEKQAAE